MAHCLFEQSGTFKNEFIKLGIPAEDYDIQNEFGETDHVVDLFGEIRKGYDGQPSIFDGKPTQYFFVGIDPKQTLLFEPLEDVETGIIERINGNEKADLATLRSMTHPQYARRFIKQYILGADKR